MALRRKWRVPQPVGVAPLACRRIVLAFYVSNICDDGRLEHQTLIYIFDLLST